MAKGTLTPTTVYYYGSTLVSVGAVDQEVDVLAGIAPVLGFTPAPNYLNVETDVDLTVRINHTSAAEIPVTAAAGLTIVAGAQLEIHRLYFTHSGASSALGDATVTVLAV